MVVSSDEKLSVGVKAKADNATPRTIVVAGTSSGVGKTSVAEAVTEVLARRCPTSAAKITVTHGERGCPHGGKGCNVCGSLGGRFQIITRPAIITQQGTDTARFAVAGAEPVLWTIARAEFVSDAWSEMRELLKPTVCAVIESNTLALRIAPTVTLMVVDPSASRRLWKASAAELIATADFVVFNDRGPSEKRRALLEEIEHLRGSQKNLLFVEHPHEVTRDTNLSRRLEEISKESGAISVSGSMSAET